jgi:hypothetical protein
VNESLRAKFTAYLDVLEVVILHGALPTEMGEPVGPGGAIYTIDQEIAEGFRDNSPRQQNRVCAYQYEGAEVHDLYSLIVKPAGQQMGRPEGVQIG